MKNNVFEEALERYKELYIKDTLVKGLWYSQFFEQNLKILLNLCILQTKKSISLIGLDYNPLVNLSDLPLGKIHQRLKTFFPEEKHKELNNLIRIAIKKRNNFIHDIFFDIYKNYKFINFNFNKKITRDKTNKEIKDWILAASKVNIKISEYISEYSRNIGIIKIKDLL
jgi:hypothetical protein